MRELIYKDEAYKAIDNCIRDSWDRISPSEAKMNIHHLVSDVNEIDRPQGEWILSDLQSQADNDNGNYAYVCTNCNHTDIHAKTQKVPYCWWCGANMKGAE